MFALASAVIVLSGFGVVTALQYGRTQALESGRRSEESLAQVIAEQTARTLQTVDLRLQLTDGGLGRLKALGEVSEDSVREVLREEIVELPFVRTLSVVDTQGRIVYSTDAGRTGVSVAERAYFQSHRTDTRAALQLAPPVRDPANGSWLIDATRPLLSSAGAFAGIVVAEIEPSHFDRLWATTDVGVSGFIALYRRDGVLMMRSPFVESAIGKRFPDLFDPIRRSADPAGTLEGMSPLDGVEQTLAYRVLPAWPDLVVVVGQARNLVLTPWRQSATLALAIWAFAAAAILVFMRFLNRTWEEKARSEARFQEIAQRLALATEAGSIGVWDWDLRKDEWFASPTYFTMLGLEPQERCAGHEAWIESVHPEDREMVAGKLEEALAGSEEPFQYEARLRHTDGSYRWVGVIGRVLARDEHGRPSRRLGVRSDITQSKLAEAALRESEKRYRTLVEWSPEAIVVHRKGLLLYANPAAVRLSGAGSAQDLVGRPMLDLVHPDFHETVLARARSVAVDGKVAPLLEERLLKIDGTPLDVEAQAIRILFDGEPAVQVTMRDITASKRTESELRSSLREKEALLKEVHHRVKNNLQVINSLLRLETGRNSHPATKTVLKEMHGRIQAMALLHEALYRSGTFAAVDLGAYLERSTTQSFRALLGSATTVQLRLSLVSVQVEMDQAMPCGLLLNELVSNSLKHGFPEGRTGEVRVELRLIDGGRKLHLRVSDTGVGLPPDLEARRDTSLGLQLVSDLARQLGGRLDIGAGPGAAFDVTFSPTGPDFRPVSG